MDSERFDGLVRRFGQTRSRRQTLGGLAGVAAGVLALGWRELAAAGSRIGGAACDRDGQCATGKCLSSGKCSCSASVSCTQPANRCKQATCDTATKRCVSSNKDAGTTCPDEGNPCTKNVCDGSGHCTHPNKTNGAACTTCQESSCTCQDGTCAPKVPPCDAQSCTGCCDGSTCKSGDAHGACGGSADVCRACSSTQTCSGGTCHCTDACFCPALRDNCTTVEECTMDCEGAVECAPVFYPFQNQCCRPVGGACSDDDYPGSGDCCNV